MVPGFREHTFDDQVVRDRGIHLRARRRVLAQTIQRLGQLFVKDRAIIVGVVMRQLAAHARDLVEKAAKEIHVLGFFK